MLARRAPDESDDAVTSLDRFFDKLRASFAEGTFVKVTLSRRRGKGELRNVYGRLVELKSGVALSFVLRFATRDALIAQMDVDVERTRAVVQARAITTTH